MYSAVIICDNVLVRGITTSKYTLLADTFSWTLSASKFISNYELISVSIYSAIVIVSPSSANSQYPEIDSNKSPSVISGIGSYLMPFKSSDLDCIFSDRVEYRSIDIVGYEVVLCDYVSKSSFNKQG